MKIGVFAVLFAERSFEEALDYMQSCGLQAVEFGSGGYSSDVFCKPKELLADNAAFKKFQKAVAARNLEISALSCHGNALHPDGEFAKISHESWRNTVLLAEKLGVQNVATFAGCPGDGPNATKPNWVTCAWPPDFSEIRKWQWEEKVIPYWKEEGKFAKEHGVRICFEMHPGFVVYNTETLLKLRNAVGDVIGANFDPSHLFWQGIDPVQSIRALGPAIFHFHAKDCKIDEVNTKVNGVLDSKPYSDELGRSWIFRTVGYGHDTQTWKDIISALRMVGYDGAISIEHEDSLMSVNEGFQKAIKFLKDLIIEEQKTAMWWA